MALPRKLSAFRRGAGHIVESALAPKPGIYSDAESAPTVAGLFGAASGIGESARLCFDALHALGLNPDAIDLSGAFRQEDLDARRFRPARNANTGPLIIHANPPSLPRALRRIGRERLAGRKIIGYWAWELPEAPASWRRAMRFVHEVWTPSAFCTHALSNGASVPVRTVPHIVPEPASAHPKPTARDVDFHVIASADARSSLARKNLEGAVRAFRIAFEDDPMVRLTVRLGHGAASDPVVTRFERQCTGQANIRLITDIMDEHAGAAFIASADAMLSLHRSEGFGLVLAKAMRGGLPVIATGWSGNMEFMTQESACLIGHELIGVQDPQGIYTQTDQVWADPDLDEAAAWLRRLRSEPALRARIAGDAARLYPAERIRGMLRDALGR